MQIDENEDVLLDRNQIARAVLEQKLIDAQTPGAVVECDPLEAELAGAFVEDALAEADATASTEDFLEAQHG